MGIRMELWPSNRGRFRPTLFSLLKEKEKKTFLHTFKNVKMSDGYLSNISRCIDLKNGKIVGLKIHDCHILMEQLLPIVICNILPNNVTVVIVELRSFFRQLCGKSLRPLNLEKLEYRIKTIYSLLPFLESWFIKTIYLEVQYIMVDVSH